jgi:DNA polymerase-3 subunit alpha
LIKSGAFDEFGGKASQMTAISLIMMEANKHRKNSHTGQIGLFADDTSHVYTTLPKVEEFSKTEILHFEKELFGFYLTEHPLTPMFSKIAPRVTHNISDLTTDDVGAIVLVGGVIMQVKKIVTKTSNQEMAFVRVSDLSGTIEVVVFPRVYAIIKNVLISDTVVLVKGKMDEKDGRLMLLANDIFTP